MPRARAAVRAVKVIGMQLPLRNPQARGCPGVAVSQLAELLTCRFNVPSPTFAASTAGIAAVPPWATETGPTAVVESLSLGAASSET
jgi:hypothetical protein